MAYFRNTKNWLNTMNTRVKTELKNTFNRVKKKWEKLNTSA